MNEGKWYLVYSIMMNICHGKSISDEEVALDAITKDAAVAEAWQKWKCIVADHTDGYPYSADAKVIQCISILE